MFYINLSIGSWFMSAPFAMKCPAWAVTPAKYNPLFLLIFCKGPLKVHILQSGDLIASSQILKSLVNFWILSISKQKEGGCNRDARASEKQCWAHCADIAGPRKSSDSPPRPAASALWGRQLELVLWLTNELNMKIVAYFAMVNAHQGGNHRFGFIEGNGVRLPALMYLTVQRT